MNNLDCSTFLHLRKIKDKYPGIWPCNETMKDVIIYEAEPFPLTVTLSSSIIAQVDRKIEGILFSNDKLVKQKKKKNSPKDPVRDSFLPHFAEGITKNDELVVVVVVLRQNSRESRCHRLRPFYLYVFGFYPWWPVPLLRDLEGRELTFSLNLLPLVVFAYWKACPQQEERTHLETVAGLVVYN